MSPEAHPAHHFAPHESDLGYLANRLTRALRAAFGREVEALDLTATQAAALLSLEGGGPCTPGDLAKRLGADRPTVTGLVERLLNRRWISISPNPADGRSKLIALAPAALEVLPALRAASQRVSTRALQGMSPEMTAFFIETLELAAANLEPSR